MTSWLSVSVRNPGRDLEIDTEQYDRCAIELTSFINDAVERGFAGGAWLKQRFPARSLVWIHLYVHGEGSVTVNRPSTKNYGGPKRIQCRAGVPASWFSGSGDVVLMFRLFRAVLQVLDTLGAHYEIGPPGVRSPKTDPGKPKLLDPFSPEPVRPSPYEAVAGKVQDIADRADPQQLIVVAHGPAPRRQQQRWQEVAQALGTPETEQVLTGPEHGEVHVWTIRMDS